MKALRRLNIFAGGNILSTTPTMAGQFLESLLSDGLSIATRNRHLAACNRFWRWCRTNDYAEESPFRDYKTMTVPDKEEIVYCTIEERERVLAVSKKLGRPDWLAVPIAFYAGCRREEIFRLQWGDINFESRRLVVRKSKTGRKRATPMAKELLEILSAAAKTKGYVVPRIGTQTWANQADRLVELIRERLARPENPNLAGNASEAIGKRRFLMTDDIIEEQPARIATAVKKFKKSNLKGKKYLRHAMALAGLQGCPETSRDGRDWIPAERIGWNAWRHTFATLRVQAGVTVDKVASWMGNSPEVCRKHYAQFMPRDKHDEDIDKL